MDPNANLQEQERLLSRRKSYAGTAKGERARLRELRAALTEWIRGGGFQPEWATCPRAAKYYTPLLAGGLALGFTPSAIRAFNNRHED